MKTTRYTWGVVICISAILAVFSNLVYILGTLHTPPGMVYLGITHSFQDYFAYISQATQGAHGAVLTNDLFTTEYTTPVFLYWMNTVIGFISRILERSPINVFNTLVFPLNFTLLILSYLLFTTVFPKKHLALLSFLFFSFSTSLINKLKPGDIAEYWPYELWGTPHFILNRLSTLPHHIIQVILSMIVIALAFGKPIRYRYGILFIAVSLLTLLQPIMTAIIVGTIGFVYIVTKQWHMVTTILSIFIGFLLPFIYMAMIFQHLPYTQLRSWEQTQFTLTTIPFLLYSIGPILPFAIVGVLFRIKKLTSIELFGVFLLTISYTLFLFPSFMKLIGITNVRVVFPALYLFFAWFAACGVDYVARVLGTHHPTRISFYSAVMLLLFLLAVAPTLVWEVHYKINQEQQGRIASYIPKTTQQAYDFLETQTPYSTVVLGNPLTGVDTIIPALTGHVSVTGHKLFTINNEAKILMSQRFFTLQMTQDEAQSFIQQEHVMYILLTDKDGKVDTFTTHYPFLHVVFQTETATVFTTHEITITTE